MKYQIKNVFLLLVCIPLFAGIAGCDFYDSKEVENGITVNYRSVNMYAGETLQLTAGPAGSSCTWTSEDPEIFEVSADGLITAKAPGAADVIVSSGGHTVNVTVTVTAKITLTDFTLNETSISIRRFEPDPTKPPITGSQSILSASPEPAGANDYSEITWRSKNEDIATVDYKGLVIGRTYGTTEIECIIAGSEKTITKIVQVSVDMGPAPTTPFRGPHTLSAATPYTLSAVDFDYGGRDNAWADSNTAANQGGSTATQYRIDHGDNLSGSGVGFGGGEGGNIGWTAANEWLVYTVEVADAGEYTLEVEIAGDGGVSTLRFDKDNRVDAWNEWSELMRMTTTNEDGNWNTYHWETAGTAVALPAGTVRLRLYFVSAAHNIRNMRFTYKNPLP